MSRDSLGNIWIGTDDGLFSFSRGPFTSYGVRDGLSSDKVYAVLEDRSGALWIGTGGGGLNRFKDGVFTAFSKRTDFQATSSARFSKIDPEKSGWEPPTD